jgi:hypothetical protein
LNKNQDSVIAKAAKLGIRFNGLRTWEPWEDNYLRRHYNDRKKVSLSRTLKRTVPAILARAHFLKLTEPRTVKWSQEEKNILSDLYPNRKNSLEQISKLLNRSYYAILLQAQTLGLKRPQHHHVWTKEEHDYLIKNFKIKDYGEIAKDLGLTHSAVAHMVNRSGLKLREKGRPWTEEEKDFIKQNYKKIPTKEIARRLNRTVNAIITIVGPLGVSAHRPTPWSDEEKEYLKKNYGHTPVKIISSELGRNKQSITAVAVKLNLTKKRKIR